MFDTPLPPPSLFVEAVTKRYGRNIAIQSISLAVPPGQAMGLVGPNGCGKTTLIKSCVGILRPEGGRVLIEGHDLHTQPLEAKGRLAYAPEFPDPVPSLTPWDHLTFCGQSLQIPGWEEEATRLLHAFDMLDNRDRRCSSLSKGERQKTMLAMAFLRRPRVLFLDEPLIGLDPRASLALKREVRAVLASGGSALISSHVLSLVEELCATLTVMARGQVVFIGTADQLRQTASASPGSPLEQAFVWIAGPREGVYA